MTFLTEKKSLQRFGVRERFRRRDCTHLCVGPMSINCVDATIELAEEHDVPLVLIASRRQVECLELGSGYVNNWDTFAFARYVRERGHNDNVILARDHGGPWQHPMESKRFMEVEDAMESAKLSFLRDIEAGFQILHIDPVVNLDQQPPTLEWVLDKVFELYAYCMDIAHSLGREILIELGTEEQKQSPVSDPESLAVLLDGVMDFCKKNKFMNPAFMVVQTGTKVVGRSNVGDFPSEEKDIQSYIQRHRLSEIVDMFNQKEIMLKEHNTDYLSDTSLQFHPKIGIHAANVAPEFGVVETSALMRIMDKCSLKKLRDEFIEVCVNSGKWDKWVAPGKETSDLEKALICGHYVFSDDRIIEIKRSIQATYSRTGGDLEKELKLSVKSAILRYMKCFGLVRS